MKRISIDFLCLLGMLCLCVPAIIAGILIIINVFYLMILGLLFVIVPAILFLLFLVFHIKIITFSPMSINIKGICFDETYEWHQLRIEYNGISGLFLWFFRYRPWSIILEFSDTEYCCPCTRRTYNKILNIMNYY